MKNSKYNSDNINKISIKRMGAKLPDNSLNNFNDIDDNKVNNRYFDSSDIIEYSNFSDNYTFKQDRDRLDKPENIKKHKKWIILGFDPGLTVGIAIIDFNGNIIHLKSIKEASYSEVVREIIFHGRTAIVASDVNPLPKMVKKLAALLNSKTYSPSKVMTVESKNEMVKEYLKETSYDRFPSNAHQRDALAAAIKTYKNYEKKFIQIEKRGHAKNLSFEEIENVKNLFINGTPITKAFEIVLNNIKQTKTEIGLDNDVEDKKLDSETIIKLKRQIKRQETQIKNHESIIKNLKDKNNLLKNEAKNQKRESSQLKSKLEKLHQEYSNQILLNKKVASKINIIKQLQNKYNHEKTLRKKLEEKLLSIEKIKTLEIPDKMLPVKIIESFTREGINEAIICGNIKKGDLVYISNSGGGGSQTASSLANISLKAVIISDKMPHQAKEVLENNNVPVIQSSTLKLDLSQEMALVGSEKLKLQIEKWKDKIKNQRDKQAKQRLWGVISEYRAKRRRDPFE